MMTSPELRTPRWARRKESRPAELISAALELFVEHGYAATRLDAVAARAGVSKGTLYLYFDSKEELFKAVVRETIVPLISEYQRDVAGSGLPAPQLLEAFFRRWWEAFGATRLAGIAKLIVAEAVNFPEVACFFHQEVIAPSRAVLATILQRGIDEGRFRPVDVDAVSHLMVAPMVLRAISSRSLDTVCPAESLLDPERFLRAHAQFVLASLRP